jgi:hypothetical protein
MCNTAMRDFCEKNATPILATIAGVAIGLQLASFKGKTKSLPDINMVANPKSVPLNEFTVGVRKTKNDSRNIFISYNGIKIVLLIDHKATVEVVKTRNLFAVLSHHTKTV